MKFDHNQYVPCLRWKQGEYQAVLGLSDKTKKFITPIIEVAEIGYDFEDEKEKKTIDEHLQPFAKRVSDKWGKETCFVDALHLPPGDLMADGRHPVSFIFEELRALKCTGVPVIGLNRGPQYTKAIKEVVSKDKLGFCLRITIEESSKSSLKDDIAALMAASKAQVQDCDLVLDLGAPNFQPIEGFVKLVESLIKRIPNLNQWRSFALIGTAFPASMGEIRKSPEIVPRCEWVLYKLLIKRLIKTKIRLPAFGDYGISHPEVLNLDMRLVKPAGTIRYTIDDAWFIVKGPNVRDYKFDQYRGHCRTVIASGFYSGPGFSEGDKYIEKCAKGTGSTGNLYVWRKVGTSHHLERIVQDVSNLFGSLAAA